MTGSHHPDRSRRVDPLTHYDALGAMVHDGGPVTIYTSRGPVICMDEQTYTQLRQLPSPSPRPAVLTGTEPALDGGSDESLRHGGRQPTVRLTARETELLQAVAAGHSAAAIADRLGLATNTVAQHLVSVRRKYRVETTAAAVIAARGDGSL